MLRVITPIVVGAPYHPYPNLWRPTQGPAPVGYINPLHIFHICFHDLTIVISMKNHHFLICFVVSNMAFMTSISCMGCYPKPIDFHSIMFQDGEIAPPSTYPNYTYVIQPVKNHQAGICFEWVIATSFQTHVRFSKRWWSPPRTLRTWVPGNCRCCRLGTRFGKPV